MYTPSYHRPQYSQKGMGGAAFGFIIVLIGALFILNHFGVISIGSNGKGGDTIQSGPKNSKKGKSDGDKLLAEARKYDKERYVFGGTGPIGSGGHPPDEYSWGKGLDCSGLINVAVLKAFDINENHVARSFRNDRHWKPVKKKDARAGDIMYLLRPRPQEDHVVIVVSNKGDGKLTVFEAYGSVRVAKPDQIRQSGGHSYDDYTAALRFVRNPK